VTRSPRPRRRRAALAACLAGAAALTWASLAGAQTTSPNGGTAAGASPGVTLTGEGSNGPYKEVTQWQNDLGSAQSPTNLQYIASGTKQGRDDLVAGRSDFAISGTLFRSGTGPGFDNEEISQLPHHNPSQDIIAAPVQVTALAFVLALPANTSTPNAPPSGFSRADQFAGAPASPFLTPIAAEPRVPSENLASMVMNVSDPDPNKADTWGSRVSSWDSFDTLNAFGIRPPQCDFNQTTVHCFAGFTPITKPTSVVQSEPDESNYYLADWIRTAAPNTWNSIKTTSPPGLVWEDPTTHDLFERMPRVPALSRQGADQAGDQLTIPGGVAGGTIGLNIAGAVGDLPPSALIAAPQGQSSANPLSFIEIPNAHGDFVSPSTATIDAAVNAGNGTPLYALTHDVKDAYPLTWVNYLYVKAAGLSAAKTEAVATVMRYLATDGQAAAAPWNEGTLSQPLVTQALQAANQVVQSNCPAAGGTVFQSNDPGPDAPNLSGIHTIGAMLHCQAPASQSGSAGVGAANAASLPGFSSAVTSPTASAPTATVGKPTEPLPDALLTGRLPIPLPGTPFDRIATVLLGGLGYFALRNPIRRMFGRAIE
jgi:hypothetical protein